MVAIVSKRYVPTSDNPVVAVQGLLAQGYNTYDNIHHQRRRHAIDELGHDLGYGICFIPGHRREIVVRRLYNDCFVSRRPL